MVRQSQKQIWNSEKQFQTVVHESVVDQAVYLYFSNFCEFPRGETKSLSLSRDTRTELQWVAISGGDAIPHWCAHIFQKKIEENWFRCTGLKAWILFVGVLLAWFHRCGGGGTFWNSLTRGLNKVSLLCESYSIFCVNSRITIIIMKQSMQT